MTSTAEHLMKMASEADTKADDLLARITPGISEEGAFEVHERAAFHRGQASGFRQSAYYAAILEGTNAND